MERTDPNPAGRQVYRTFDTIGWLVLIALALVFLGTGYTIRSNLYSSGQASLGDDILLVMGLLTLVWGIVFYSFRVAVHVRTTPAGVTLIHGPWRHTILWEDVVRVGEWTDLLDGLSYRWFALWSTDGLRMQLREDVIGNAAAFRSDVVHRLEQVQTLPDAVTDLRHPYIQAADIERPLRTAGFSTAVFLLTGLCIVATLPTLRLFGLTLLGIGIIALIVCLRIALFRQEITIGPAGIGIRHGPLSSQIPWPEVYALEREEDERPSHLLAILGRGLLMILFRLDKRSGIVLGPLRQHSTIRIRGGSGISVRIREQHYQHPEWLRTRLRAQVEALRARPEVNVRVKPLAPTGKLDPAASLPPEPVEGESAIWLRESMGFDPFRAQS